MNGLEKAAWHHISTVVYAFVLTALVFSQIYTEPSLGSQTVLTEDCAVQDASDQCLPIEPGTVVLIEYVITIPEFELTMPPHFIQFVSGQHELLPKLERALTGMKHGEGKRVELGSDEAFGSYDESKKFEISRDRLPKDVEPGMVLATEDGLVCVVVDLWEDMAQIDFNHPLAGKHVVIDVRILEVEELSDHEFDGQSEISATDPFSLVRI